MDRLPALIRFGLLGNLESDSSESWYFPNICNHHFSSTLHPGSYKLGEEIKGLVQDGIEFTNS